MNTTLDSHATKSRWPLVLTLLFAIEWVLLALQPIDRHDWLLENVLALVVCTWLIVRHRRAPLSTFSYVLLFLFGSLHEIGAHYTYSEVPYEQWAQMLGSFSVDATIGFERNMFDRVVHFLFGFLLFVPIQEILDQGGEIRGRARWWVPVSIVAAASMTFELFEWAAAEFFGGDLGQAYLGTQGDVWDAHKDMLLATVGSMITMVWVWRYRGKRKSA